MHSGAHQRTDLEDQELDEEIDALFEDMGVKASIHVNLCVLIYACYVCVS